MVLIAYLLPLLFRLGIAHAFPILITLLRRHEFAAENSLTIFALRLNLFLGTLLFCRSDRTRAKRQRTNQHR